jgi:hypothetical protein
MGGKGRWAVGQVRPSPKFSGCVTGCVGIWVLNKYYINWLFCWLGGDRSNAEHLNPALPRPLDHSGNLNRPRLLTSFFNRRSCHESRPPSLTRLALDPWRLPLSWFLVPRCDSLVLPTCSASLCINTHPAYSGRRRRDLSRYTRNLPV